MENNQEQQQQQQQPTRTSSPLSLGLTGKFLFPRHHLHHIPGIDSIFRPDSFPLKAGSMPTLSPLLTLRRRNNLQPCQVKRNDEPSSVENVVRQFNQFTQKDDKRRILIENSSTNLLEGEEQTSSDFTPRNVAEEPFNMNLQLDDDLKVQMDQNLEDFKIENITAQEGSNPKDNVIIDLDKIFILSKSIFKLYKVIDYLVEQVKNSQNGILEFLLSFSAEEISYRELLLNISKDLQSFQEVILRLFQLRIAPKSELDIAQSLSLRIKTNTNFLIDFSNLCHSVIATLEEYYEKLLEHNKITTLGCPIFLLSFNGVVLQLTKARYEAKDLYVQSGNGRNFALDLEVFLKEAEEKEVALIVELKYSLERILALKEANCDEKIHAKNENVISEALEERLASIDQLKAQKKEFRNLNLRHESRVKASSKFQDAIEQRNIILEKKLQQLEASIQEKDLFIREMSMEKKIILFKESEAAKSLSELLESREESEKTILLLKSKIKDLSQDLDAAIEMYGKHIEQLGKNLADSELALELRITIENLETANQILRDKNEVLENTISELSTTLESQAEAKFTNETQYFSQVKELQKEIDQFKSLLGEVDQNMHTLELEVQTLEHDRFESYQENNVLKIEIGQLKTFQDKLIKSNKSLQFLLKEANAKIESLSNSSGNFRFVVHDDYLGSPPNVTPQSASKAANSIQTPIIDETEQEKKLIASLKKHTPEKPSNLTEELEDDYYIIGASSTEQNKGLL